MLGITIAIPTVICVVAIGNAGQARVQQQLNNSGDNFVWIEAGGRAINGVRTGTHDTKTLVIADAIAIKDQVSLIKSVSPNVDDPVQVIYGNQNWLIAGSPRNSLALSAGRGSGRLILAGRRRSYGRSLRHRTYGKGATLVRCRNASREGDTPQ